MFCGFCPRIWLWILTLSVSISLHFQCHHYVLFVVQPVVYRSCLEHINAIEIEFARCLSCLFVNAMAISELGTRSSGCCVRKAPTESIYGLIFARFLWHLPKNVFCVQDLQDDRASCSHPNLAKQNCYDNL